VCSSDLGSWLSLYELKADGCDGSGNVLEGDIISVDCSGCLVHCLSNRTVATLGLENILIVDTGDVLLVSAINRSQEVKKVVDELKARLRNELL
jgi:mannose-1-phosphate guanylyltransferase